MSGAPNLQEVGAVVHGIVTRVGDGCVEVDIWQESIDAPPTSKRTFLVNIPV